MEIENRDELEAELARAIARRFGQDLNEIMREFGDSPDTDKLGADFWGGVAEKMLVVVRPALTDIAVAAALRQTNAVEVGVDWALVNTRAVEWASTHTFSLVSGLNDTSRAQLQRLVGVYFEQQLTLAELRKRLTGVFGPVRAEAIAVTEVTRASVNGELAAVAEIEAAGIKMTAIWNTNADERVCPICVPRNGKARGDGWQDYPPVHVRDRCWISHAISTS